MADRLNPNRPEVAKRTVKNGSKPNSDDPCFILIKPDVNPDKPHWRCSICPPTSRPIGAASLRSHLSTITHLAVINEGQGRKKPVAQAPDLTRPTAFKETDNGSRLPKKNLPKPSQALPLAPRSNASTSSTDSGGLVFLGTKGTLDPRKKEAPARAPPPYRKGDSAPLEAGSSIVANARKEEEERQEAENKRKADARAEAEAAAQQEELARKKDRHVLRDAYRVCRGAAEELVKGHLDSKRDPVHDWGHVDRVRRLALEIADTFPTKLDIKIVELVALFHGLVASNPWTTNLNEILSPFLHLEETTIGLTYQQITMIKELIPSVSWKAEVKPWTAAHQAHCFELHAVQDADRLEGMGAIGLMRSIAANARSKSMMLDDGTPEGKQSVEAQFRYESLVIAAGMKTKFGAREAEERNATIFKWDTALEAEKEGAESAS